MNFTTQNAILFLVLLVLMLGPWTWMLALSDKWNDRLSRWCFFALPLLAFYLTFGHRSEQWSATHALFSNDGGGVDYSRWLREATPGAPYWQDNYWLGSGGEFPVSLSYALKWAGMHPLAVIVLLGFCAMCYGIVSSHKRNR